MALITCESIVLSLLLFARSCASQSTAMTTYTSSNFIGYYISPDGQAETLNAGNAWTTSGTFAGDCDSDSSTCSLATACLSETLYFNNEEKLSWFNIDTRKCIDGGDPYVNYDNVNRCLIISDFYK
ncbi:hypothetical protein E8E14_005646 [Neopestalotiopsis sp. 37M]|nr:hypothetical protein E8E14_005646 [Neopestalotiopsis sp. 37M]